MDYGFTCSDIENIAKLLGAGKEEEENKTVYYNQTGSVLTPNNITGNGIKKDEKELARPYCKIELKDHNRILTKPENQIWKEKELKVQEEIIEDGRETPEYDILYKQTVGTEDVYFGMTGKDNSSNSCEELTMKIKLPNTLLKEISIEVKQQSIHLNAPKYVLNYTLPYPVVKDKSVAKWDKEKSTLQVTLPIIKKSILDCFD